MKKTLMSVLKQIVKAIYPLVKAKRRFVNKLRSFFSARKTQTAGISNSPTSINSAKPAKSKKSNVFAFVSEKLHDLIRKPLWKDKRVIISACALALAAVTIILVFSLAGDNNSVYASDTKQSLAVSKNEGLYTDSETANTNELLYNQEQSNSSYSADTAQSNYVPTTTPAPTPVPTTEPSDPDLVPGVHDTRVIEIQKRLMELDYMEYDEPTDYYGGITEYSLQLFQRKHNLQVDGLAGEETLKVLFSDEAKPYTVKLGDRGTDVKSLQERLIELKYLKSSATSYFGTDTESAVKSFQKRNGLYTDGNIGEYTREALYSESARAASTSSGSSSGGSSSGSSGSSGGPIAVGDPDKASADALINLAKSLLGSKYVRGGKGPSTFDCSGFVYYCLNTTGYRIGYMTSTGWKKCSLPKVTKMSDMKPGDIIVFKTHHVGIYIGNGEMIDASSGNGKVVRRSCTTSYWKREFVCGRRVF